MDACYVRGGGTLYQWQELILAECQYRTWGVDRDGTVEHDYPANERRLVPLGHWYCKWNEARSNYSI